MHQKTTRLLLGAALVALALAAFTGSPALAQPGQIAGRVLTPEGEAVDDAEVLLVEPRRRTSTAADGTFTFAEVPPGRYLVEARSPRFGATVERIEVAPGARLEVELRVDWAVHREQIVVSAGPAPRGAGEAYQPVTVLSDRELELRRQPTLGETLAQEAGVSSSSFAPGASRPVIRGLGGDRIRVLRDGLDPGDASTTSPDHAVGIDMLATQTIEILRGPATLLYGSSAIGGVVNVVDERVPDHVPDRPLGGTVEVRGGSAANERAGAVSLGGGLGERWAWHFDLAGRRTDDYEIPGPAEVGDDGHGHTRLDNSFVESEGGSLGFSYVGERGYLGMALSGFDSLYGVPGHEHDAEGEAEEEEVFVDLQQRRLDLRGAYDAAVGPFRGVRLRLGLFDYDHVEIEGGEPETEFDNRGWELRLEAPHRTLGRLEGAVGFQAGRRDFSAVGEETFVPPTETESWALFVFEELPAGPVTYQLGARFERQAVRPEEGGSRSFSGVSTSGGLVWVLSEDYSLSLSLARSTKLPNAEELFSDGPHLATGTFEIGDPGLGRETSLGFDLGLRKRRGTVTGELHLFANRFDDFIFPELTGEVLEGLQVLRYTQRNVEFVGGELHVDFEVLHRDPHHLELELMADYVRASLRDTREPLPRIPPMRLGAALRYRGDRWWGVTEVRRVFEQDRVALLETATDDYTSLNAVVGYRFFWADTVHDVMLRGTNLTDEVARNHVSFQKDRVPLPGRDVVLAYRMIF